MMQVPEQRVGRMALQRGLHIKIDEELAAALKRLSTTRSLSIGELVRRAIRRTYLAGVEGLSARQGVAVAAYDAGYISLGKLADEIGMDAISVRRWLSDNGFEAHETFDPADAGHV